MRFALGNRNVSVYLMRMQENWMTHAYKVYEVQGGVMTNCNLLGRARVKTNKYNTAAVFDQRNILTRMNGTYRVGGRCISVFMYEVERANLMIKGF